MTPREKQLHDTAAQHLQTAVQHGKHAAKLSAYTSGMRAMRYAKALGFGQMTGQTHAATATTLHFTSPMARASLCHYSARPSRSIPRAKQP
jgi:LAS superfamily LD-carboxypeptidase LdcB